MGRIAMIILALAAPAWAATDEGRGDGAQAGTTAMRRMRYTSRSRGEALAWQKEVREQLFEALKLDDLLGRKIDLKAKVLSSKACDGYTEQEVEINSTPGRRIKVVLTMPKGEEPPLAAVVCIHGHGGNRHVVYDRTSIYKGFAAALAARGAVTISTDVGQHEVFEKGRLLMGERLWDVMRCVDYVASLPQVDGSRIGCAGLSLGGEMAMWLGAMDTRISAEVSCGFLTVMDQMEKNHCMCWKFPGLRELVDYADIYALTAPRALQCQNGLKEGKTQFTVPIARQALSEIQPIYRDLGRPDNVELCVHGGGHEVDLPALLAFFEKHLGIAAR
ncbi:MAG: acetylxylan esterase [Phycisphaerae bacterium]|nr:acetylxylan esterase [Phycisphaerae bacterium]